MLFGFAACMRRTVGYYNNWNTCVQDLVVAVHVDWSTSIGQWFVLHSFHKQSVNRLWCCSIHRSACQSRLMESWARVSVPRGNELQRGPLTEVIRAGLSGLQLTPRGLYISQCHRSFKFYVLHIFFYFNKRRSSWKQCRGRPMQKVGNRCCRPVAG